MNTTLLLFSKGRWPAQGAIETFGMRHGEPDNSQDRRNGTIAAMKAVFGADTRRIEHSMKVLDFAETILTQEPACREVVVAAAILHDVGIREAERKYGSTAGRFQEIEGPPIARGIMEDLGFAEEVIEHVCRIIANHHSAHGIDSPEFRIVWDADWLVNLPDEFPEAAPSRLDRFISRVFRTATGRRLARSLFQVP